MGKKSTPLTLSKDVESLVRAEKTFGSQAPRRAAAGQPRLPSDTPALPPARPGTTQQGRGGSTGLAPRPASSTPQQPPGHTHSPLPLAGHTHRRPPSLTAPLPLPRRLSPFERRNPVGEAAPAARAAGPAHTAEQPIRASRGAQKPGDWWERPPCGQRPLPPTRPSAAGAAGGPAVREWGVPGLGALRATRHRWYVPVPRLYASQTPQRRLLGASAASPSAGAAGQVPAQDAMPCIPPGRGAGDTNRVRSWSGTEPQPRGQRPLSE